MCDPKAIRRQKIVEQVFKALQFKGSFNVFAIVKHVSSSILYSFLFREAVFDTLVEEVTEPGEGEPLRHLDVAGLASDLFNLGAKPDTLFRNRSALYEISSILERSVAKKLKKQANEKAIASGRCDAIQGSKNRDYRNY